MTEAKVKIDITAGTIELEGSEAFVTKYLDEFKTLMSSRVPEPRIDSQRTTSTTGNRANTKTAESAAKKPAQANTSERKRKGAPKISPEKYDIHGDGDTPSLKAFFEGKNPGRANGDRIAVIGYYITEVLGNDKFSEGQIEYSYKMLNLDRPGHLHQVMINTKNEKDYYEQAEGDEPGHWIMTRGGDIFVSDELPRAAG